MTRLPLFVLLSTICYAQQPILYNHAAVNAASYAPFGLPLKYASTVLMAPDGLTAYLRFPAPQIDSSRLGTNKFRALETALRLRTLHERFPHEPGAEILSHQHTDAGIDRDHVGVVPLCQWIESIHEAVAAPGLAVTVPDVFENSETRLR